MPSVPKPQRSVRKPKLFQKVKRHESNPLEETEQIALAQYLDLRGFLWCHVPNGGMRHPAVANRMKAQGVKPGVPDILIMDKPYYSYCATAIELKRKKGGVLSEDQRYWTQELQSRGWAVKVCHGFEEAKAFIEHLYGPHGSSKP